MYSSKTEDHRPLAYCVPCSERTPHRYERLGVNGRQTSRAICLVCNNDSRSDPAQQSAATQLSLDNRGQDAGPTADRFFLTRRHEIAL